MYALYDITGIQKYVFSSNTLKEIVGGSALLKDALSHTKLEKLLGCTGKLVYTGGGNAFIRFDGADESQWLDNYRAFNTELSKELIIECPSLSLRAVVDDDSDADGCCPARALLRLFKKMAKAKLQLPDVRLTVLSLPSMAQDPHDRLPVVMLRPGYDAGDELQPFSASRLQRIVCYNRNSSFGTGNNTSSGAKVMRDFRQIAQTPDAERLDSCLAVIHIDGNNMGKLVEHAIRVIRDEDLGESAREGRIADFSTSIDDLFKNAVNTMWQALCGPTVDAPGSQLRVIYQAGDDLTYVCQGSMALRSVELIFNRLIAGRIGNLSELSACAGIAYVHADFPFSDAYAMAKRCCKNAKTRAAQEHNLTGECIDVGYWVDYTVLMGGSSSDLPGSLTMRPLCYRRPRGDLPELKYDIRVVTALLKSLQERITAPGDLAKRELYALRDTRVMACGFVAADGGRTPTENSAVHEVVSRLESKNQVLYREYSLYEGASAPAEIVWSAAAAAPAALRTSRQYMFTLGDYYTNTGMHAAILHDSRGNPTDVTPLYDAIDLLRIEVGL
ncbi:MAG: hypothetical protein LBD25_03545 [Coriobacteriales bacterium]|jgi:hypothetical protein|nr:hypothetical protein [Coriobacteriales bacterium]